MTSLIGWLERAVFAPLRYVAAALMMTLMLLTAADVIGRYFFNKPIFGGFELTEIVLAILIFAGLPLTTLRGGHITVDLLDPFIPPVLLRIQNAVMNLVAGICTAYLSYRLYLKAGTLLDAGETTLQIGIKIAYVCYAMSFLMALTALAFAILAASPSRVSSEGSAA